VLRGLRAARPAGALLDPLTVKPRRSIRDLRANAEPLVSCDDSASRMSSATTADRQVQIIRVKTAGDA
jgi:hypothetical protein